MQIDQKQVQPDVTVVTLTGRMVLGNELQRLEQAIDDLVKKQQKKIVFDLAHVDYIDSSGLGVLVSCMSKAKAAGGQLRVAGISDRVMKLFKMTRLDSTLRIDATVEAACSALAEA